MSVNQYWDKLAADFCSSFLKSDARVKKVVIHGGDGEAVNYIAGRMREGLPSDIDLRHVVGESLEGETERAYIIALDPFLSGWRASIAS